MTISVAPDGTEYDFPTEKENKEEIQNLINISKKQRKKGREIVVVQGMGFVGSVMAAVVADAEDDEGNPLYFVHGNDLVTTRTYWKIPTINSGKPPVSADDPEIAKIFPRTVIEKKTLRATWQEYVYKLADYVIVDIQLDAIKPELGKAEKGYVDLNAFKKGIRTIGKHIKPDCLVLVETTVPPGTCEKVIKPIIEEEFAQRNINSKQNSPLIAHSYERVMPGKNYVSSIRNFWRTFSGINKKSADKAEKFLNNVLDTKNFPIKRLNQTSASELAKVLENSYRATNIALMKEWAIMAEEIGVNIFDIIDSVRVRKGTHDNMLKPSLGVGGYCLTKDPVLAHWSAGTIFDLEKQLPFAIKAVNINDEMPLHTLEIIEKVYPHIENVKISILGVSYHKDVADTRHSPTKTLWDRLMEKDAIIAVHDPYVEVWHELGDMKVPKDLNQSIAEAEIIVFAVGHKEYLNLDPEEVLNISKKLKLVIDCSNFLTDSKIKEYLKAGCEVRGVGKGHIEYLKSQI